MSASAVAAYLKKKKEEEEKAKGKKDCITDLQCIIAPGICSHIT